jgi:YHS domain-containing protein
MATDPARSMFVEEKPYSIRCNKAAKEYYFCMKQGLDEFTDAEKEFKKRAEEKN